MQIEEAKNEEKRKPHQFLFESQKNLQISVALETKDPTTLPCHHCKGWD